MSVGKTTWENWADAGEGESAIDRLWEVFEANPETAYTTQGIFSKLHENERLDAETATHLTTSYNIYLNMMVELEYLTVKASPDNGDTYFLKK